MLLINKYVPAQRFALWGSVIYGRYVFFLIGQAWPIPDPVLRHGWDGFSFHGAKVRKKIDTRKREGVFF